MSSNELRLFLVIVGIVLTIASSLITRWLVGRSKTSSDVCEAKHKLICVKEGELERKGEVLEKEIAEVEDKLVQGLKELQANNNKNFTDMRTDFSNQFNQMHTRLSEMREALSNLNSRLSVIEDRWDRSVR